MFVKGLCHAASLRGAHNAQPSTGINKMQAARNTCSLACSAKLAAFDFAVSLSSAETQVRLKSNLDMAVDASQLTHAAGQEIFLCA